jgi:hypothetical protein
MYNIVAYLVYLGLSLIVVLWVGKILHRNGKEYLFAECHNKQLSGNANNILYIGYVLVNTGFAFYFMNRGNKLYNFIEVAEYISFCFGYILSTLGIMHFINMILAPRITSLFIKKQQPITNNQ